jgi:hypothetical protein
MAVHNHTKTNTHFVCYKSRDVFCLQDVLEYLYVELHKLKTSNLFFIFFYCSKSMFLLQIRSPYGSNLRKIFVDTKQSICTYVLVCIAFSIFVGKKNYICVLAPLCLCNCLWRKSQFLSIHIELKCDFIVCLWEYNV